MFISLEEHAIYMIIALPQIPLHFHNPDEAERCRKKSRRQKQIPAKTHIPIKIEGLFHLGPVFLN